MVDKRELVALAEVDEIVKTAIYSGHLEKAIPMSIILIAPSGCAKSKLLLRFGGESIDRSEDLTSSGLYEALSDDKEGKLKHFLLGDFNTVLSHKSSVTGLTVASLLSITSDGTVKVSDGRRSKDLKHAPCGILTAATPKMFSRHYMKWEELGFLRRFIPIHYTYTTQTRRLIMNEIKSQKVTLQPMPPVEIKFNGAARNPAIAMKEAGEIENLAYMMTANLAAHPMRVRDKQTKKLVIKTRHGEAPMEFTPALILQTFARSHAAMEGRGQVNDKDISFLERLVDFTNFAEPKKL